MSLRLFFKANIEKKLVNEQAQENMTIWLKKLEGGKDKSLDDVMGMVYQEMRQLAHHQMQSERANHTLCTTGLVNEAYLKFCNQADLQFSSRQEFFAFASQCMRHILVDYARKQGAIKRGKGEKPVQLIEHLASINGIHTQEICDIDLALNRLNVIFPRGASVIQYRLFGGFSLIEVAEILEVSSKTVQRDWTTAIAWLRKEVHQSISL